MTDDRSLDRAARAWLEEGPTHAPDRPVDAALTRIQAITQERDLRIPWRPKTMFDRIAVVVAIAVLAIGTVAVGASLILQPTEPPEGACPRAFSEADAVDTFGSGLTRQERAWGIASGAPAGVAAGSIAAFAWDAENVPVSVITLDPISGERCRLVRFTSDKQIGGGASWLEWSPSGDALAIGIRDLEDPGGEIPQVGHVLIWTSTQLYRVWSGTDGPEFEWAPDGRSIALWASDTRLIFADGSPDRTFDLGVDEENVWDRLRWSADGSQWIVSEPLASGGLLPTMALALVNVADGRTTPIDLGTGHAQPIGFTDHGTVIISTIERDPDATGYLDVPIADPRSFRVLVGPDEAISPDAYLSPDGTRLLYLAGLDNEGNSGTLTLIDVRADGAVAPVELVPAMKAGSAGFAWSPDGSRVLFHPAKGGLWTVNVDGSGLHQVATADLFAADDPWQPVPLR